MPQNYVPIFIFIAFVGILIPITLLAAKLVRPDNPGKAKLMPYECGVEPVGTARERQSVKFYLVAMAFLLFDIEAVFLVPWAVVFRGVVQSEAYGHLKYVFYGEMMVFMVVLFVGLVYVWRKGILEWNR